jgi:ubiquitin-protein ligase
LQKEFKKISNPVENCKKKELGRYQLILSKAQFRKKPDGHIIVQMKPEVGFFKDLDVIVEIEIPSEYPFKAPDAKFLTPLYHPNVSDKGQVCKDILSGDWGPAKQIVDTVAAILNLLVAPSLDGGPLNSEAAAVFKTEPDKVQGKQKAFMSAQKERLALSLTTWARADAI